MRAVVAYFEEIGAELNNVGLRVWTHPRCTPISHELVKVALQIILDRSCHPLLLVSSSGTHQVGSIVGCLRRLQGWNLTSIFDEYRSYAAPSPRLHCEQFIELWDNDLVTIPATPPAWFEAQQELLLNDLAKWSELHRGQKLMDGRDSTDRRNLAYFRVSGPLASRGVTSAVADEDEDN